MLGIMSSDRMESLAKSDKNIFTERQQVLILPYKLVQYFLIILRMLNSRNVCNLGNWSLVQQNLNTTLLKKQDCLETSTEPKMAGK